MSYLYYVMLTSSFLCSLQLENLHYSLENEGIMSSLQVPVVFPSVQRKQGGFHAVPTINGCLTNAKGVKSGMWAFRGFNTH
ncbi:unnamed protein product [Lactuca virosa]|uniref:Secreted protein n=1 Tax=Lactuca virosa TaxID=75947 RepID=A0AAU9NDQ0_9ASTR|nr:unnamed protein product [Lactuca virosa]